jgi:hypothetical protein
MKHRAFFLPKLMHSLNHGKSSPKSMGSFCIFPKLPKVNNHPMDENSPSLVTLSAQQRTMFVVEFFSVYQSKHFYLTIILLNWFGGKQAKRILRGKAKKIQYVCKQFVAACEKKLIFIFFGGKTSVSRAGLPDFYWCKHTKTEK